jgi:hypothetical protein
MLDDTICALVRELATSGDPNVPGTTGRLLGDLRGLTVELMSACETESGVKPPPADSAPHLAPAPTMQPGYPNIKSPRILEWDYIGELEAQRQEQGPRP